MLGFSRMPERSTLYSFSSLITWLYVRSDLHAEERVGLECSSCLCFYVQLWHDLSSRVLTLLHVWPLPAAGQQWLDPGPQC